jgi:hypothetical protein
MIESTRIISPFGLTKARTYWVGAVLPYVHSVSLICKNHRSICWDMMPFIPYLSYHFKAIIIHKLSVLSIWDSVRVLLNPTILAKSVLIISHLFHSKLHCLYKNLASQLESRFNNISSLVLLMTP